MKHFDELFPVIDRTSELLSEELAIPYLDALVATGENLFHGEIMQPVNEVLKKRLMKDYSSVSIGKYSKEEIRKSFQLAALKGLKEGVEQHHSMTPDAVALFVAYLVNKLTEGREEFSLLDPAVGTGNLLIAILNQLHKEVHAYGSEVENTFVKLTYVVANLTEHPVELLHQDSLEPLMIDPVDMVVCDLPVGYYPNDHRAASFQLKAEEGHSYAHHLFIEQSLKHTKEGGSLIFIVPNHLFETEEAPKLNAFLKEQAIILGLLQLPLTMFKQNQTGKSILILQKKGEGVTMPKQALLAELPSFSNKSALEGMIQRIDRWFEMHIKYK